MIFWSQLKAVSPSQQHRVPQIFNPDDERLSLKNAEFLGGFRLFVCVQKRKKSSPSRIFKRNASVEDQLFPGRDEWELNTPVSVEQRSDQLVEHLSNGITDWNLAAGPRAKTPRGIAAHAVVQRSKTMSRPCRTMAHELSMYLNSQDPKCCIPGKPNLNNCNFGNFGVCKYTRRWPDLSYTLSG